MALAGGRSKQGTMALVLPPVVGAAQAQKDKLAQLRLLQVDDAVSACKLQVSQLRDRHVRNAQTRRDGIIREQNRARRDEAKQERLRTRHKNATKIQALFRSHSVRRLVMPSVLEDKAQKDLAKSRVALADTMLGLNHTIHDLAFLEQDIRTAATRIQAWWRGVLGKRVVAIIVIRHHLNIVSMKMAEAATRISATWRGRQGRLGCQMLSMEKANRLKQAQAMAAARRVRAVVKLQSHARRRTAMAKMQERRAEVARLLEAENAGSPPSPLERNEARKSSPERGRMRRQETRKLASDTRGKRQIHAETSSITAFAAFEGCDVLEGQEFDLSFAEEPPRKPAQPQGGRRKAAPRKSKTADLSKHSE